MPARVAFVIPVLEEEHRIGDLLRELRQRYPAAELVVVDGGSSDRTVAIAMPLCDQLLLGDRGRALQMNLGGRVAAADYLCFLHADTVPTVPEARLRACLQRAPDWGFCRVRLSGGRPAFRVIEYFMNLRSRLSRIATGDQMLFLRRELFERTGGFDPLPLMEDIAYCKRLRRLARPVVIPEPVVTSSRRWEQRGVLGTVLTMWSLRLAYFLGVPADRLWRFYYGR